MTPERRRDFETEWPQLAQRLHKMLARRGMQPAQRDDVVQETAARLYGTWEDVDRSRPAWPLTRAIALNHLRDQARRKIQEVASELPEVAHHHNVEDAGIARVELGRVRDALGGFSEQARSALLVEVGGDRDFVSEAAEKMQRMRARKKLRLMLERAPAAISLRFSRLTEVGEWLLGGRAALNGGISCLACAAIGMAVIVPTGGPVSSGMARVLQEPSLEVGSFGAPAAEVAASVSLNMRDAHDLVEATHLGSEQPASVKKAKKAKKAKSEEAGGESLLPGAPQTPPLPTNGYGPEFETEVAETPGGGGETPGLPTGGGGESPGLPGGPGEGPLPVSVLGQAQEKLQDLT